MANRSACKLLGYSKKELLTKYRSAIFDLNDGGFRKMLKVRAAKGQAEALLTVIKKDGKQVPCRVTSAVFVDEDGIKKSIATMADLSQSILEQENIDIRKEKIEAHNILSATSIQKAIDTKKERKVAGKFQSEQKNLEYKLAEYNEWKKNIGKVLYDVMWDWDIITGKIYVGDSIEEVFGYKLQNNTAVFADFIECLLPDEKDIVEKKLMKALASTNKSWSDSYKFKRHDGSVAATICRASIARDNEGKAVHLIGAIQDVSRMRKLEEQIRTHEEDNEKFLFATKLSFDVIWDWNLSTNEVIIGEGFEELFGYKINDNRGDMIADWVNYLHPDDKEALQRELRDTIVSAATRWEHAYRVTRADGSVAKVLVRASIIRDADGKAYRMIGAMHDINRQKELEKKLDREITVKSKLLADYKVRFKQIFNSSSDILYDVDLVKDEVIISDAFEKQLGYKISSHMTSAETWLNHIHPDDKEAVMHDYRRVIMSDETEWKYTYRFLRADNSVADVISNRIILRDAEGKAYRILGSMRDISTQKILEEKLEREIKLKEKQIEQAMQDAKERERSDIGKELHDNINQLLGASKLYIDMAKHGGKDSELYLSRSSEYTLMAIEEIRKLTKGLTTATIKNLGLSEAIGNITRDTMEVSNVKISYGLNGFKEDSVNDKFKLNVFRIIQEQLNNIIKYAKAFEVYISLSQNIKSIELTIIDDGIGFDTKKKQKGIGLANIKSRVASFNGEVNILSQIGKGCSLTIKFPHSALITA